MRDFRIARGNGIEVHFGPIEVWLTRCSVLLFLKPALLGLIIALLMPHSIGPERFLVGVIFGVINVFSIVIHELGHGLTYLHINGISFCRFTLHRGGGLFSFPPGKRIPHYWAIVAAGPMANLLLFLIGFGACVILKLSGDTRSFVVVTALALTLSNLVSFVQAMIPTKGSDGEKLRDLYRGQDPWDQIESSDAISSWRNK